MQTCNTTGSQCGFRFDDSHILDDPERYRRLIGKLMYLIVTRPDIIFVVKVLS